MSREAESDYEQSKPNVGGKTPKRKRTPGSLICDELCPTSLELCFVHDFVRLPMEYGGSLLWKVFARCDEICGDLRSLSFIEYGALAH